jgi:tetratricopeptide (TPR) repeat protein
MKLILTVVCSITFYFIINSQVINKPNFALATHPMTIEKVELSDNQTIVFLTIENQLETGTFCADKNIYLQDVVKKEKYKLIKTIGIPVCPENYQFTMVGETKKFQLYFPKLKPGTSYINIIEDCQQYCFSIKGIILDTDLNNEINLGYEYYAQGKLDFALASFIQTASSHIDYPFGNLYFNIIQILTEVNEIPEAKIWYKKLLSSNFVDKKEVLERLKQQYYYQKLIF